MRFIVALIVLLAGCGDSAKLFGGLGGSGFETGGAATGGAATGGTQATGGASSTGGAATGGAPGTGGAPVATGGAFVPGVTRIWPIGDSITAGAIEDAALHADYSSGGWRAPLFAGLTRRGMLVDFVGSYPNAGTWALAPGLAAGSGHDGHSGISAARVRRDDFLAAWAPALAPNIVLLSLGTNDPDTVEAGKDVGWLIDRVRALAPLATIFVATNPPAGGPRGVINMQIAVEVAARPGVRLVDMFQAGLVLDEKTVAHGDYSGPLFANLHPSVQGYAKMAALWEKVLVGAVQPGTGGVGGAPGTGGTPGTGGMPPPGPQPCDGFCTGTTAIAPGQNSGALGTDAVCHQLYGQIAGITCGNFIAPRTLAVNGVVVSCSGGSVAPPPAHNGGYCFVAPAGQMPTAYFTTN